jgi:hypothetical protein
VDLSAQKLSLSAPNHHAHANESLSSRARTPCIQNVQHSCQYCLHTAGNAGVRNVGPASGKVNHNSAAPATALQRHHDDRTRNGVTALDMDLGLIAGVVMLVGWAIATFGFNGPGWVHLFLSVGVFLVIWRYSVLTRRKPAVSAGDPPAPSRRRRISGERVDSPTGVPLFRAKKR